MTTSLATTAPTQFLDVGGIRFAYRRFGTPAGTPLVFTQHFMGNLDNFDPAISDALAPGREIILFDNTGVGSSTGTAPDTIAGMAADAASFIDGLGLTTVDILGHSMGGEIAQLIALDRTDLVRRLVLVGTGPRGGDAIARQAPDVAPLFTRRDELGEDMWLPIMFSPSKESQAAGRAFISRITARADDRDIPVSDETIAAYRAAARGWGSAPVDNFGYLGGIAQPTLVVNGNNDIVIPTISLLGTPEYMAPEVADIAPATPAADLYSIGIVLYEMLAGRTPFAGGHPMAVLHRQLEQVPVRIPGTRADLWALVEWLLAKDPRSRPSSAAEAAAALGRLELELAGEPALPPMPPLPQLPAPPTAPAPARSPMAVPAVRAGAAHDPALSGGYPQLADPADLNHPATVLSHLYHPDAYAPTGDWSHYAPSLQPVRPAARAPEPPRSRVNPRLTLAVVAAVVLVLAAAIGLLSRPAPESAAAVPAAVSYTFAPQEYPDGLLITRRWTLGGRHGSMLTETVSASSATGHGLRVPFQDEIPSAVAPTTHTVVFTPAPTKIVKADPVVEWLLRLRSHGTVQVGYHATVPPLGVIKARLMGLVKDFDALRAAAAAPGMPKPRTILLTSLAIEPGAVQLKPGRRIRLELTGRLSNGQAAPQAVLDNAAWNPANPAVASVTSPGTVTGVSAGITHVTAQIGSAQASVPVTVTAVGEVGAGGVGHRTAQEISFTSAPPPSPAAPLTTSQRAVVSSTPTRPATPTTRPLPRSHGPSR